MIIVPPGMATLESTARHLRVSAQRLRALTAETPLRQLAPVPLGRSLGTYRLIPQLGIAVLRQMRGDLPYHLHAWQAALADVLDSSTWRQATAHLTAINWADQGAKGGQTAVEEMLVSPALRATMEALQQESAAALDRHGLQEQMQTEKMIVDRLEDNDDAVILVGAEQRAYALPRSLLRLAGLDREKVWGVLIATQTSTGVDLDVWPAAGLSESATWRPDPDLLAHRIDVGTWGA